MIKEKVQLLGNYTDIPKELTLTSIPTASELEYVGSEDFEATMLDSILPAAVEEKNINFRHLLEIDFQWLCRCLRIINYGPYYTTNAIFCNECNSTNRGEYQVDLRSIECKELPPNFSGEITITRDNFIDFDGDVVIKMLTIQDSMNAFKDSAFTNNKGEVNRTLARMCYMVKSIKNKTMNPIEAKMFIQNSLTSADYIILKNKVTELTDYGLRAGGSTTCPKCGNKEAAFIALVDDRFLRPTMGDLRRWKDDRSKRSDENTSRGTTTTV